MTQILSTLNANDLFEISNDIFEIIDDLVNWDAKALVHGVRKHTDEYDCTDTL